MATVGVKTFELTRFGEAEAGNVFSYPEAASQSFKTGDPVKLNTSGQVLLAVDTEDGIWGIAWEDATGTTANMVLILVLTPAMVFAVSQSNAGAAQASAQTQVGLQCSYIKSTVTDETTKTVLDTADTTTPTFEIIYLDGRDPVGDSNGRVLCRVIGSAIKARPS